MSYKQEKKSLAKAAQKLSTRSFEKIWDYPEDSVYDNIIEQFTKFTKEHE